MTSVLNLPHGENTLDDLFECFIETLHSTHTAIAFDTDANQKLEFKAYLFTAIVPITTVATGLDTDDKCHKVIMSMIQKIEFIQYLNRDDDF